MTASDAEMSNPAAFGVPRLGMRAPFPASLTSNFYHASSFQQSRNIRKGMIRLHVKSQSVAISEISVKGQEFF